MINIRWDSKNGGRDRVKAIPDASLAEYLSYGWIVCDNVVREPVETPVPVVPVVESPLDKLTKAVDAVVDAPKVEKKRKAGRPPKRW